MALIINLNVKLICCVITWSRQGQLSAYVIGQLVSISAYVSQLVSYQHMLAAVFSV